MRRSGRINGAPFTSDISQLAKEVQDATQTELLAASQAPPFCFFDLPPELRVQILQHLVVESKPLKPTRAYIQRHVFEIFDVSPQLSAEALLVFFAQNTFELTVTSNMPYMQGTEPVTGLWGPLPAPAALDLIKIPQLQLKAYQAGYIHELPTLSQLARTSSGKRGIEIPTVVVRNVDFIVVADASLFHYVISSISVRDAITPEAIKVDDGPQDARLNGPKYDSDLDEFAVGRFREVLGGITARPGFRGLSPEDLKGLAMAFRYWPVG